MVSPYPGVSRAAGSLTASRAYRARRSMPDRRFPGRRRSMPVRRSCSGPPGGPRCCWRLSVCARRSSSRARRSPRPRRSPGVGGLLGLAEPVSPGRVSSVSLGLPFLSVGRFMPVYLPVGSCSAARHWAPTRRVLDPWERSVDAWRKRASCQAVRAARLAHEPVVYSAARSGSHRLRKGGGAGERSFDIAYFAASVDTPKTNKEVAEGVEHPVLCDPVKAVARAYGAVTDERALAQRWVTAVGGGR